MAISLGTVFGDVRIRLDSLRADATQALTVFTDVQTKLASLGAAGAEEGAKIGEAVAGATPAFGELGVAAEDSGRAVLDALAGIQTGLAEVGAKAQAAGDQIVAAMEKAGTAAKHAGEKAKEGGFNFGEMGKKVLEFTGAAVGMSLVFSVTDKLAEGIHSVLEEAGKAQVAETELNTVIQSTGNKAGVSADELERYATHLSETTAFTKDEVLHGESMLLTFTNIGAKALPQATTALLNMTQMMGGDAQRASILLGKALNDPIKGVTALTRVGVTLDDQQKKLIKTYVKHGETAKAQQIILDELNKEFGKQAEAYGKTLPGQMAIFQNKMSNTAEEIGKQLMPKLQDLASKVLPVLEDWLTKLPAAIQTVGDFMGAAGTTIGNVLGFLGDRITNIVNFWNQYNGVIKVVAGAITIFLLPALIKTGVESAIAGAKLAANFIASVIKTGVESVIAGAKTMVSFVKSIIASGVEAWTAIPKLAAYIGSLISTGVQAVIAGAKTTASFIASVVQAGAKAVVAGAQIVASFVASLITTGAQAVATGATMLASLVPAILSTAAGFVTMAVTGIASAITGFIAYIPIALAAAAATLAATWPFILIGAAIAAVIAIIILLVTHWSQVIAVLGKVAGAIGGFIGGVLGQLGDFLGKVVSFFEGLGQKVLELILAGVNLWLNIYIRWPLQVLGVLAGLLAKFIAWALDLKAKIEAKIIEAVASWLAYFLTLKDKLVTAGGQIIQGLLSGLQAGEQAVINFITGLGQKILSGIKSLFGIASPSKEFAKIGGSLGDGLVVGLKASNVHQRVADHLSNLSDVAANSALSGVSSVSGLSSGVPAIASRTPGLAASMASSVSGPGVVHQHEWNLTVMVDSNDETDGTPEQVGQSFGTAFGQSMSQAWSAALTQRGYNTGN